MMGTTRLAPVAPTARRAPGPVAAIVLLAALAAPVAAQDGTPTAGAPRALALGEALALAEEHALRNLEAGGELRSSRARLRSAWAAFVPSLSLSAGLSKRLGDESGGTRIENGTVVTLPATPWSYSAGLGASVELFGGGQRFFALRQARAGITAAEAGQVADRFAVELDVKQQYFDVLASRESERAAEAQLEQAEQQLRASVLRLRAASATKSDSLRSRIQLGNAQLALEQAREDVAAANAALQRAIGVEYPVTAAEDDSTLRPVTLGEEELARLAADGPAVRQARARLDAARALRASTWADYLPSVTASWNRSGSGAGQDAAFGADDLDYTGTVRLSLSLPLFDQLGRETRAIERDVAARNAEATLRDAQLGAREELVRARGTLRTAERRVEVQTASVTAAEEDLRVQQRRYGIGESTLLDVLTSQSQLNDARVALIRARYDQRVARAQLEALIGRNLEGE